MESVIQKLQGQWNQVIAGLNQCKAVLEDRVQKWKEFEVDMCDLDHWLLEAEGSISKAAELREDLPEKASLLEEVKV